MTKKNYIPFIVLILCINLIVYFPGLNGRFIWDDHDLLENNEFIKDIKNVKTVFVSEYWEHHGNNNITYPKMFYRPIALLSYIIDYSLWKENTFGYRLHNLLLHSITSLLIFGLISHFIKNVNISFISTLFYSLHPSKVQTINYASLGRTSILAAFFFFLSFFLYSKYDEHIKLKKTFLFLTSLISYALAILSNETAF